MYMNTVKSLAQAAIHFLNFILSIWILPTCNSIQVVTNCHPVVWQILIQR